MVEDNWETKFSIWKENKKEADIGEAQKLLIEEKVEKLKEFDVKKEEEVKEAKKLDPFDIKEIVNTRRIIILLLIVLAIAGFVYLLIRG